MEDLNRSEVSKEEFILAYKEYASKSEKLSFLVKKLVRDRIIRLEDCYWLKTAIMNINNIDEFLKYNMENLHTFDVVYSGYVNKFTEKEESNNIYESFTPVTIIKSHMKNNPYVLIIKPNEYDNSEITYRLKDYITLQDANDYNQGVIMMKIKTINPNDYDGIEVQKLSIENGILCHEDYKSSPSGNIINTTLYDLNYILSRLSKVGSRYSFYTRDYMITPDIKFLDNLPKFITKEDNIINYIVAYENIDNPGVYNVEYRGEVNDRVERINETMEGESFYDAYNNFMINKGFFKDNKEKTK